MIVRMKKFTLVALTDDKDALYNAFAKSKTVEFRQVADMEKTTSAAAAETRSHLAERINDIENAIRYLTDAVSSWNVENKKTGEKAEVPKNGFARPKTELTFDYFLQMETRQTELNALLADLEKAKGEKNELLSKLSRTEAEKASLALYKDLPHPTTWYHDTENVIVQLGTVPTTSLPALKKEAENFPLAAIEEVASAEETLLAVAVHKDDKKFLDAAAKYGYVKSGVVCDVLPAVRLSDLDARIAGVKEKLRETEENVISYAQYVNEFKVLIDYLDFKCKKLSEDENLRKTDATFVLEGFCPADSTEKVKETVDGVSECSVLYFDDIGEDEFAPTLNKNNKVVEKFELVTNMYTPPSYHEIDPNPVMSVFYFIIFGLMVADIGYGLTAALLGLFAHFAIKQDTAVKRLLSLFGICGISAMIVGALFGSFFSFSLYEGVLPDPGKYPMVMMIVSLYVGILHIMAGIGCNVYKLLRRKDVAGALFDALVWEFFFAGLMLVAFNYAMQMMTYEDIPWTSFRLPDVATKIGLYMIIGALAVVLLTGGRNKKGIGKITGGLAGLYGIINYVGDILSYIRVFGLLLSSALMGSAMNGVAAMVMDKGVGGMIGGVLILIVAHVFNLAMGLLSVYIHNGRLQYVEFFGKFYEGDGQLFVPFASDTKYTLIQG